MNLRKLRSNLSKLIEHEITEFKDSSKRLEAQFNARGRGFGGNDLDEVTRETHKALNRASNRVLKAFNIIEMIDDRLNDDLDPTPYCAACNAIKKEYCECIGGAEND
jgi:hypothetical protein